MQTETLRDSTPIHIGKIITIGSSPQEPPKKPIESTRITTQKRPLKAVVQTFLTPGKIVDKYLDEKDKETMIRHITSCQKNDSDWGTYRKKVPDELLSKWAKVMNECLSYGFIAPVVYEDKLHWKRIVMHDVSACDKCTLCPMSFKAGQCTGKIYYKASGERVFRTCWE